MKRVPLRPYNWDMVAGTDPRTTLRMTALAARKAMSSAQRRLEGERIVAHLLDLPEVREAESIAVYLSLPDEVSTFPLIDRLRQRADPPLLAAPVVLRGRKLAMYPLPPDLSTLQPGPFGIPEPTACGPSLPPASFDVILVPGVAFDLAGHRLGYGAGYYDRYLSGLKRRGADQPDGLSTPCSHTATRPCLIGLAFVVQLLPHIPPAPQDVHVDLLVTRDGVHRCATA